jgi:RNA polymerase sigma-70 factor (ECF subfamily)
VQEVFFILWQKKENIDLSKSVKSYLTSAVRNKCLNFIRDHKKFSDTILESEDQYDKSDSKQGDRLIEEELKKKIKSSIEELPSRCREVFVLSRYENFKYQEIADRLPFRSKQLRHRCRRHYNI